MVRPTRASHIGHFPDIEPRTLRVALTTAPNASVPALALRTIAGVSRQPMWLVQIAHCGSGNAESITRVLLRGFDRATMKRSEECRLSRSGAIRLAGGLRDRHAVVAAHVDHRRSRHPAAAGSDPAGGLPRD
jgi:hypothetical protein